MADECKRFRVAVVVTTPPASKKGTEVEWTCVVLKWSCVGTVF